MRLTNIIVEWRVMTHPTHVHVAKTYKVPYHDRSFSAKESDD